MKNCRFNKHTHTIWIYSITINNNEPKSLIPFRERSTGCPDTSFVKLNPGIKRVNNVFRLYFRNVNFICIGPRTIRVSFTKRLLSWWRWVCCFRVQSISFFFYFSLILLLSLIVVWIDSSFFFNQFVRDFPIFLLHHVIRPSSQSQLLLWKWSIVFKHWWIQTVFLSLRAIHSFQLNHCSVHNIKE